MNFSLIFFSFFFYAAVRNYKTLTQGSPNEIRSHMQGNCAKINVELAINEITNERKKNFFDIGTEMSAHIEIHY